MNSVIHNLSAMNASRQLNMVNNKKEKSAEKLSSGYRINRAADDAAGLAISEKMRRQIRGLKQASDNSQDGISLCKVADGALNEVSDMLHRITELSVKAANGTNTQQDRDAIQMEVAQITDEINRISETTTFNTMKIFRGGVSSTSSPKQTMQSSLAVEVTNASVYEGNYQISATENGGVEISTKAADGTLSSHSAFTWGEIKNVNDPSKTLADAAITAGTYTMEKNGIRFSFEVPVGSTKADVAEALNGAEFTTNIDAVTFTPITVRQNKMQHTTDINANPGSENMFANAPYQMHADADGIWMTSTTNNAITTRKVSWSSMGITPDTIGGKEFIYICPDTGLYAKLAVDSNATFDEIVTRLNGTKVWHFDVGDKIEEQDPRELGDSIVRHYREILLTEDFFLNVIPSNIDRMNVAVELKTVGTPGANPPDLKFAINLTTYDGYPMNGYVTHYLEPADQATKDFLATPSFTAGTEAELRFADNYGNEFLYKVKVGQDCPINYVFRFDTYYSTRTLFDTIHVSVPSGNLTHTSADVSDVRWQGSTATGTDDAAGFWIQCSADAGVGMNLEIDAMSTALLGIDQLDVSTVDGARDALDRTEYALEKVNKNRSKIGAQQNRLEHTVNSLDNTAENTTAAESRIRDTDMALEMMMFSQRNILSQAGESMLAQLKQSNQGVMQLLQQ